MMIHDLSSWTNVTKPAYQVFGQEEFLKDLNKIIFHHYTFNKPWMDGWDTEWNNSEPNSLFLNLYWHEIYKHGSDWIRGIYEKRSIII